jgi:hypothetical protein
MLVHGCGVNPDKVNISTITQCDSTTDLAWFIANNPDGFLAATNEQLYSLKVPPAKLNGTEDIYYYTATCMWHAQANSTGANKGGIKNIINIYEPGIITIYNSNGAKKEINLNDYEQAKAVYNTMPASKDEAFNSTIYKKMIKNLAVYTYAVQTYTPNEGPYKVKDLSSAKKVALYYFWHKGVHKYMKSSNLLYETLANHNGKGDAGPYDALKTRAKFEYLAEHMFLGNPLLEKKEAASTPSVEYKNGKAYIGPFKVQSANGIPEVKIGQNEVKVVEIKDGKYLEVKLAKDYDKITLTDPSDSALKKCESDYEKDELKYNHINKQLNEFKSVAYLSEKDFYVELDEATAKSLTNIKVDFKLNYSKLKAKLAFSANELADSQQIMFHNGTEEKGTLEVSWIIEESKDVTIQKRDANGDNLNIAGISFEVYDLENKLVKTLTTDETGKTGAVKLLKCEQYTIKEKTNNAYGYKGCTITGASIINGKGTLEVTNENLKVTVEENSTIAIKNTPELGKVIINKKDEEGNALKDVEFVLWQGSQYIQLWDDKGTQVLEVAEEVTINKNNTKTEKEYTIVYVDNIKDATKFKTNALGKIIINNLEINMNSEDKYEYWLIETANNNYGYKSMVITQDNISATGGVIQEVNSDERRINFTIGDNIEITLTNTQELGNIEIEKVGEDGKVVKGVAFVIRLETNKYIKVIDHKGNKVTYATGNVIINNKNIADQTSYRLEYVTNRDDATRFITDQNGKVTINNLEINKSITEKYNYTICEVGNNQYGYTHEGNTSLESSIRALQVDKVNQIKITNTKALGNISLTKEDKDNKNKVLEDAEFIVTINQEKYIKLKDENGNAVESIKGTAIINKDNKANETEYTVIYTKERNEATRFITNDKGQITIENLEVYSSGTTKNTYNFVEIANPNYGYSIYSSIIENTDMQLDVGTTQNIGVANEKALGGISIVKVDEKYENILLEDIEFVLSTDKDTNIYIALYNQKGLVKEVKGTAIINNKNITNDGEYTVKYVKLEKEYLSYSESERKALEITVFKTDAKGKILVNNLEVNSKEKDVKYKYRLTETYNPYYGYEELTGTKFYETTLNKGEISSSESNLTNEQEKIKISGYVWLENSTGKANEYDGLYKENNVGDDNKLIDLYKMEEGKLVLNPQATTKVQVKLRNKDTGNIIKELPDEFDTKTGKYTFTDIEIANLTNYEVVFVYDGFKYTTVVEQLDKVNGSKVKEVASERKTLNNKFETVKDNSEVIPGDGTENSVEYDVKQHEEGNSKWQTSEVSKINFNTNITATTTNTEYNLDTKLHDMKKDPNKETVEVIDNVNMGIALREQPKISINNDIYSALVEFDGYKYNYKYNGRQNYYENKNDDSIGVKFEQENTKQRYTRTVYASDIQAAADPEQRKDIKVSITYKMQIANESRTLKVMPKQIINYFDARYKIQAVGLSLEGQIAKNELGFSTPENVEGTAYKSTVIDFNQMIEPIQRTIFEGNVKTVENVQEIYITFNVERDAIIKLLDGASTYHNAVEILSYATYYGEGTAKIEGKQFATELAEEGSLYAGIDKMSQLGNMELKLIDHPDGDGTQILDTTSYEDDTASAPSLILEATESRKISGTVWEDSITNRENNQKLGDGMYNRGEKAIRGVIVSLHRLNKDGSVGKIATYSNGGDVTTTTDEKGNYTFGCDGKKDGKYVGILPGKYVIKYTYGDKNKEDTKDEEAYIVEIDGEDKKINVNDYKSTIIPEAAKHIKTAFGDTEETPNTRWYLVQESNRYSDARDDITRRPEYKTDIDEDITVKNSTYNTVLKVESMDAYTPKMYIGIEFTEEDEAKALDEKGLSVDFNEELNNIDFGIVERPNVNITLEKQITGLEIIAQNGTVIIPNGDPSNPGEEMQYVKTGLDGVVPAEIDPQLLQGAQLNLEYTITVTNNCDRDYLELSYYYYGIDGQTESTTTVKKVADYLNSTMVVDMSKTIESGSIWEETTAEKLYIDGHINKDVHDEIKEGDYKVFTTNQFEGLGPDEEKTIKLYTTKYLAISDIIIENNTAEIIELTGTRTAKGSILGNNIPNNPPPEPEPDGDEVKLIITPPTGITVNYNIYIIATVVTFIILLAGIVIIKKKIIK